ILRSLLLKILSLSGDRYQITRFRVFGYRSKTMHPPLTPHRHPLCLEIIEEFQKCHLEHPIGKFFGECTELKVKLDRSVKRKVNFERSKKLQERLKTIRKEETAET
ncbi:unnamed protein product, partial [Brassica rapa subsp. trilocularis]